MAKQADECLPASSLAIRLIVPPHVLFGSEFVS
jgi:hypothetical protein